MHFSQQIFLITLDESFNFLWNKFINIKKNIWSIKVLIANIGIWPFFLIFIFYDISNITDSSFHKTSFFTFNMLLRKNPWTQTYGFYWKIAKNHWVMVKKTTPLRYNSWMNVCFRDRNRKLLINVEKNKNMFFMNDILLCIY